MLTENAQKVLNYLPTDGSAVGHEKMRERLNLSDFEYNNAKNELIKGSLAQNWKGRGGSLRRILAPTVSQTSETPSITPYEISGPPVAISELKIGESFEVDGMPELRGTVEFSNAARVRVRINAHTRVYGTDTIQVPMQTLDWSVATPVRRLTILENTEA